MFPKDFILFFLRPFFCCQLISLAVLPALRLTKREREKGRKIIKKKTFGIFAFFIIFPARITATTDSHSVALLIKP